MKRKVTIGVCVRNSAATIHEAIESIICQDYPHELMEVIFVDDGSEDNTLPIIQEYVSSMDIAGKVFHTSWQGLGAARNLVVENAEGKYIVWVDGDMILPKDHVKKQVEFMEKHPTVGIAKARYGSHPEENIVGKLENIGFLAVDFKYGGKVTSRTLGTGGSIYRVETITQVGGFDDHITGVGEDMDAEQRIRNAGWLLYLGTPAIFYERRRKDWKNLWDEGFWHGYGGYYVIRKNGWIFDLWKMIPPIAFMVGAWYSTIAYRITYRKMAFLLPFQYAFKRIAWCFGFVKGQIDGCKRGVR